MQYKLKSSAILRFCVSQYIFFILIIPVLISNIFPLPTPTPKNVEPFWPKLKMPSLYTFAIQINSHKHTLSSAHFFWISKLYKCNNCQSCQSCTNTYEQKVHYIVYIALVRLHLKAILLYPLRHVIHIRLYGSARCKGDIIASIWAQQHLRLTDSCDPP